jgi:hypothetical protein
VTYERAAGRAVRRRLCADWGLGGKAKRSEGEHKSQGLRVDMVPFEGCIYKMARWTYARTYGRTAALLIEMFLSLFIMAC